MRRFVLSARGTSLLTSTREVDARASEHAKRTFGRDGGDSFVLDCLDARR